VQHIELAHTLVSLPQKEDLEEAETEAEPMPQRPLVLAGFPLDPGMRRHSTSRQRNHVKCRPSKCGLTSCV
jgi:hypothetical protein